MSKLIFTAISFGFLLWSCDQGPYKQAIDLNKKGTQFAINNQDSALYYFDKAIEADSTYQLAIQNKTNILIGQKKYTEALKSIEQLLHLKTYPEALEISGMLHEILQQDTLAQKAYKAALNEREKRIKNSSDDKIAIEKYALGMTYILLGDTIKGKKLIEENFQRAKAIPATKDSLLKYASNREKIIELTLK